MCVIVAMRCEHKTVLPHFYKMWGNFMVKVCISYSYVRDNTVCCMSKPLSGKNRNYWKECSKSVDGLCVWWLSSVAAGEELYSSST